MIVFIDYVFYSKTREELATLLRIVLQTLRVNQLYAKAKCDSWMTEVKLLGHMVSQESISVDLGKIDVIL